MALVVSQGNRLKVVDLTDALIDIPNNVGILNALNLFADKYSTQKRIEIRRLTGTSHLIGDRNWDERNQTVAGSSRDAIELKIPHFPVDDAIYPNDIDGNLQVSSVEDAMSLETVATVRAEKMVMLRNAHSLTLEAARMQLITAGTAYAPNGTLRQSYGPTYDFYTEWGATRTSLPVALSASADPRTAFNAAKAAVRAAIRNGQAGSIGFVVLCSNTFYNALYQNAFVTEAAKYLQNSNMLLGSPVASGVPGLDNRFEQITLWGIRFINAGDAGYELDGTFVPYIAEGDAYMLPTGIANLFETYYAPANRFASVNKQAQGSYWFEYADEKDSKIEIMTEQNFLNITRYPEAIVELTLA
jgi:hypothetical protein